MGSGDRWIGPYRVACGRRADEQVAHGDRAVARVDLDVDAASERDRREGLLEEALEGGAPQNAFSAVRCDRSVRSCQQRAQLLVGFERLARAQSPTPRATARS
jgi:hypothetical protein